MTSRRIVKLAVYFSLLAALALVLLFVLAPMPVHAQSSPTDQFVLPVVAHATSGKLDYKTEIELSNPNADAVLVNFAFFPVNTTFDPHRPLLTPTSIWLAPRGQDGDRKTIEVGDLGINGKGRLAVSGCAENVSCAPVVNMRSNPAAPTFAENTSAYRAIGVTARMFNCCTSTGRAPGTLGDALPVMPWYLVPSSDLASIGMDRISVLLREDARFHSNITVSNESSYSDTFVTVTLFDGMNVQHGKPIVQHLGPMEQVDRSAVSMFPELATNRLNRTPPIVSPWISVAQSGSVPNAPAKLSYECASGCPAFNAYASVTDGLSGDFWVEAAQFDVVNQSSEVAAARKDARSRQSITARPADEGVNAAALAKWHSEENDLVAGTQARPATSEVSLCRVVGPFRPDSAHNGQQWFKMLKNDGATISDVPFGEVKMARAACSGGGQ